MSPKKKRPRSPPTPPHVPSPPRRHLSASELALVQKFNDEYTSLDSGSFACSGVLPFTPGQSESDTVQLFFTDTKKQITHACPLPFSDAHAALIYESGVPFESGSEAINDITYQKVHEIKPPHFVLNYDILHSASGRQLISSLRTRLGVEETIYAKIRKLEAYGVGSSSKAQKNTSTSKENIGTLVFCLPSSFTGGELVVKQDGKPAKFDWGKDVFGQKHIAWGFLYSDCEYEILPVNSGTRITISYGINVGAKPDPQPKIVMPNRNLKQKDVKDTDTRLDVLSQILKDTLTNPNFLPEGGNLAINLQNDYSPDSISKHPSETFNDDLPNRLKGCDALLVETLKDMNLDWEFLAVYDLSTGWHLSDDENESGGDCYRPNKRVRLDQEIADKTFSHKFWTSREFFAMNNINVYDDPMFEEWGVEKDKTLVWINLPENYYIENNYTEYGEENEEIESTVYVAVAIKVELPPFDERDIEMENSNDDNDDNNDNGDDSDEHEANEDEEAQDSDVASEQSW